MTPRSVPLPGLVGRSPAWAHVCKQVDGRCSQGSWLVLVGEPGVGKLAVAEAALRHNHPTGRLAVIDGAAGPEGGVDDFDAWVAPLRDAAAGVDGSAGPGDAIVIRHLDRLGRPVAAQLVELLAQLRSAANRPWVVGTLDAEAVVGPELDPVLQQFDASLNVPPLRHRTADLAELVPALLARHAVGGPVECDPDVMQTLMRHDWAGNVGELEQVLREALSRRRVGQIKLEDLPEGLHAVSPRVLTRWEAVERDAIVRALIEANGNRTEAAARLSLSRATIYRKIHAYGITVEGRDK